MKKKNHLTRQGMTCLATGLLALSSAFAEDPKVDIGEAMPSQEGSELISVSLDDTPLNDAVRLFARLANINIISSTQIEGNVTVNLNNVAWEPALQAILDSIPDAIYFKDAASRFIRISESMARMFGLQRAEDAVGKCDADFFTSEHADQAREDELRIMRTGESIIGRIEKETWPDRDDTWASSTKLPLCNADGEITTPGAIKH